MLLKLSLPFQFFLLLMHRPGLRSFPRLSHDLPARSEVSDFWARLPRPNLSRSLSKSQPVCALQAMPEDLGHARATLGQAGAAHLGVPLN